MESINTEEAKRDERERVVTKKEHWGFGCESNSQSYCQFMIYSQKDLITNKYIERSRPLNINH